MADADHFSGTRYNALDWVLQVGAMA